MTSTHSAFSRAELGTARRIVIKIGSRSLLGEHREDGRFGMLAEQIAYAQKRGAQAVVVSSGAVLFGWKRLGLDKRPQQIGRLQAAAATGQARLMRAYAEALAVHRLNPAEVLLTHADLAERERYLSARSAMEALLELGAVPVVNENGVTAHDELSGFGDNDQLAAMVCTLVGADLLVLLTEVEGLLDSAGKRVSCLRDFARAKTWVVPKKGGDSLGGMGSKLDAAERATLHGVAVVLGDARDSRTLQKVLEGQDVGTFCPASPNRLSSRKHWIAYTLKPQGALIVDPGAVRALARQNTSLLLAGVVGVRGAFFVGDAVRIMSVAGEEIGRGLTRYDVGAAARLAGRGNAHRDLLATRERGAEVAVHRDDLIVYGSQ